MKNKTTGFFFLIIFLLLLPNISAQTYKRGDSIDLKIPFEVNGTLSTNSAYCNISIKYPNESYLATNIEMTNQNNGYFNYTIPYTKTNTIGEHEWLAYCCDTNARCAMGYGSFYITQTGNMQTTSQGIASAVYLMLMLALTIIFLYGGFKFAESEYLWIFGIFSMFLCFIFVVYDVWLGYEFHLNLTGLTGGSGVPEILFYIFMFLLIAGFLISLALLFTKWKKLYKYIKTELRKKKENEELDDWENE